MKLLISALALGLLATPAAEAAACHRGHGACHRHYAYHHHAYRHHYRRYAGIVVPPPYYYSPYDQPLYGPLGVTIGAEYWGNRSTFKLLMQSIGDRPYND